MIIAGYAIEETHKHACKSFRSQPITDIDKIFKKKLNKSSHSTHNKRLYEKVIFVIAYISEANAQLMEKFMFAIKEPF